MIPFNKPYVTGLEQDYLEQAVRSGRLSGNGIMTRSVCNRLQNITGASNVLLTTSCSTALDMAAILSGVGHGDEVIVPSFTFPSTANAFVQRGAVPVFADSTDLHPNVSADTIAHLITERTSVIVVTHYAGVPCNMDAINRLAGQHNILVVEDAAMALGSTFNNKPVGSLSPLTAFSFHETKVLGCGEGGALALQRSDLMSRAEIIWEKGTNRAAFQRGQSDHYEWVDIGSSFLPSEIQTAWLMAQLKEAESILNKRTEQWNRYYLSFQHVLPDGFALPVIPENVHHNGSIFYVQCPDRQVRNYLISALQRAGIMAVFHYLPLHSSKMGQKWRSDKTCNLAEKWSDTLVRLPLYHTLSVQDQQFIIDQVVLACRHSVN
ncbi:MAG TPA: dTDP-4-amino-4,6-dideoxygalactose transaminase [Chitinophagales bacterium]|nr:dTDP-4-amino-4,6-dideoxygalactose transaminase [Chitinophagales bacterium]